MPMILRSKKRKIHQIFNENVSEEPKHKKRRLSVKAESPTEFIDLSQNNYVFSLEGTLTIDFNNNIFAMNIQNQTFNNTDSSNHIFQVKDQCEDNKVLEANSNINQAGAVSQPNEQDSDQKIEEKQDQNLERRHDNEADDSNSSDQRKIQRSVYYFR